MVRRSALFASLFVASACGGGHRPTQSPAPASKPAATELTPPATPADAALGVATLDESAKASPPSMSLAELDRRTAVLFGDPLHADSKIPVPSDTTTPDDLETVPNWDIEVRSYETVDRVQMYINAFSGPARDRFIERLRRGTRYESMIRDQLRAAGLPEDMYFLAMVESGFNPHAYSSAAAVGMWQFMTATAKGMGLRVDWWVDERRDPVRSTRAAVLFLAGLREQFGSMYLAAAAYNGGPGRIARGLTRFADDLEGTTGDDMFFALAEKKYLRNETRDYVPQLVASALVAKDPLRYAIAFDSLAPLAYDSVRVGPRVPLAAIASAAGTTVATIQELNPHILRGMTPPRDSLKVRIPAGSRERFDTAFAALPQSERTGARSLTISAGATWSSLARKEPVGVTAKAIALYNPGVKPSRKTGTIAGGTAVLIPTAAVVAAGLSVPDPAIERYGSGSTYVVRKGDNLSRIANRYGTTPAAIMRLNRMKKPLIFPGQELLVRGTPKAAKTPAKSTPKASAKSSGGKTSGKSGSSQR